MWAGFLLESEWRGVDYDGMCNDGAKCESTRTMWAGFSYDSGRCGLDGDGVWLWKSGAMLVTHCIDVHNDEGRFFVWYMGGRCSVDNEG